MIISSLDNYCYCPEINECAYPNGTVDEWAVEDCYQYCRDGFLRVGNCYGGIPIIMTAPHFWNADPDLLNQMEGLEPVSEKHDTFLDIEPITGVALSAHKRIQVSSLSCSSSVSKISELSKISMRNSYI